MKTKVMHQTLSFTCRHWLRCLAGMGLTTPLFGASGLIAARFAAVWRCYSPARQGLGKTSLRFA
jgi:membrane associated rhomboid family serine protease